MIPWIAKLPGLDIEIQFGAFRTAEIYCNGRFLGKGRTRILRGCKVQFEEVGKEVIIEAWNYGAYGMQVLVSVDGVQLIGVPRTYLRRGSRDITQT